MKKRLHIIRLAFLLSIAIISSVNVPLEDPFFPPIELFTNR